jgi:hypothetical protein
LYVLQEGSKLPVIHNVQFLLVPAVKMEQAEGMLKKNPWKDVIERVLKEHEVFV